MEKSRLRQSAQDIYQAALKAVDPYQAIKNALSLKDGVLSVMGTQVDLSQYRRIIAVGGGKAGAPMSRALEDVLGDRLNQGLVVVKEGHLGPTGTIRLLEASHPVPDARGAEAAGEIVDLLKANAAADTLVFCLISGGGSALMVGPAEGISLADKQETTRLLLAAGAEIGEINAIRKHLSLVKGGRLALAAAPARIITLIVSDVVGDRLDVIASGPTVADTSTWADCAATVDKFALKDKLPPPVAARFSAGLAGQVAETPKPGDPVLESVGNLIVAGNFRALQAAADKARDLGFAPLILSSTVEGETKDIARMHAAMAREVLASGNPIPAPCALISGGETTVTLGDSAGKGGRNMEFALAAAFDLAGLTGVLGLSLGTDGTDGPTDAAGAMADGSTLERARGLGLDPAAGLAEHDAYNFFAALGDLIITGPTLTNVMDVRLMLIA